MDKIIASNLFSKNEYWNLITSTLCYEVTFVNSFSPIFFLDGIQKLQK
ncbi:hypothetical protein [Bacillus sp. FSL K6-0067]